MPPKNMSEISLFNKFLLDFREIILEKATVKAFKNSGEKDKLYYCYLNFKKKLSRKSLQIHEN